MENETEKSEFPTDQGQGDNIEQTDEYKSNTDSLSASDIKKDPDSSAMPADETNISEDTNNESDADFKGTFLQPSTSDQPDEADKLISTVTKLSGETSEINKPSSSNRMNDVTDDTYADNIASGSEMHLDYEEGDEGNYPQSVHSDAGEGSSDAGQFEVIEIDDEDEDVQAMFAESQRKHRMEPPAQDINSSLGGSSFKSTIWCSHCTMGLPSVKLYQEHFSEYHPNVIPYRCEICNKPFLIKDNLRSHMRSHRGRSFPCAFCDSKFKFKHHLKKHMGCVHKLFPCGKCVACFKTSEEYSTHRSLNH
ncbi:hypothetical protein Btru_076475 [Bulinus truncatus]|nr:hypothetical protein Btru_076475 [Bulinus truncatus]